MQKIYLNEKSYLNKKSDFLKIMTFSKLGGCLIPFLLVGTTVTLSSLKTVKKRPLLSRKIETWLKNSWVIHYKKLITGANSFLSISY